MSAIKFKVKTIKDEGLATGLPTIDADGNSIIQTDRIN